MTDSNQDSINQRPYHKHLHSHQPNNQFYNDYQTNTYATSNTALSGQPFSQSQTSASRLYTISNQQTSYYPSIRYETGITGSRVRSQSKNLTSSRVKNEQVVKGESRINYVPYQKKVIQYQDRQYVEKVPIKKKKTRMQERRVVQTVPKQVMKTQYYAVQKRVQYKKEVFPQKKIEMVPVQKKIKRYEYVPVQKQIVHYPQNIDLETAKSQSRMVLRDQGINIKGDAQYKPINPTLIYNYSDRPQSRFNNIGYVDQGTSRVLSTAPTPHQQTYMANIPDYSNSYGYSNQTYQTGGQTYQAGQTNNFASSTVYSYSPFQHMGESKRQTYMQQSSPQVLLTTPQGGVTQQLAHRSRGSYITQLSNLNQRQEVKRPFEQINQTSNSRSRTKPGIKRYTTNEYSNKRQQEVRDVQIREPNGMFQ